MQRIKILGPHASHSLDQRGAAVQSRVAGDVGGDMPAPASRAGDRVLRGLGKCCQCCLSVQIMLLSPQAAPALLAMNKGDQGPHAVGS